MAHPIPPDLLSGAESILVVKPSSFGDIIHTLPAVAAICRAHPHLEARWVINAGWKGLLEGNPHLTEVISFPRKEIRGIGAIGKFRRWGKSIRRAERKRPEVVLDFQGLLRSALISRARRAEATVGISDAREGARHFYRHVVEVDRSSHAIDRYLRIPEALGVPVPPAGELEFDLPAGDPLDEGVEVPSGFVLLHPYSRGAGKSLSEELIRVFCEALDPVPVVLVGQNSIAASKPFAEHVVDLTNRTTISQLIGLMRRAAFTVSVDSGPMHLAAAIGGERLLGIHTWTDPRKVGPYHPGSRVWKAGEIRPFDSWDDREAVIDMMPDGGAIGKMASYVRDAMGAGGGATL